MIYRFHGGKMTECTNCGAMARLKEKIGDKQLFVCDYCGYSFEISTEQTSEQRGGKAYVDPLETQLKKSLSGDEIYSQMERCAVEIAAFKGSVGMSGSGFVISDSGYIITNAHVVTVNGEVADLVFVGFKDGDKIPAVIVAVGSCDPKRNDNVDLALLFAPDLAGKVNVAVFADSDLVRMGEKVYCIGNSRGEGICITSGIVSDNKRKLGGSAFPLIMTDAAVNAGNSGGPLLNEGGNVISVIVAERINSDGMKYSIPSNIVKQFLKYINDRTGLDIETKDDGLSSVDNVVDLSFIFSGVKLVIDVVAWIINLGKSIKEKKALKKA